MVCGASTALYILLAELLDIYGQKRDMKCWYSSIAIVALFAACNNSGESTPGDDSIGKDNTTVDTVTTVPGGIDTANDTMSYDRMPNRVAPDSGR